MRKVDALKTAHGVCDSVRTASGSLPLMQECRHESSAVFEDETGAQRKLFSGQRASIRSRKGQIYFHPLPLRPGQIPISKRA
jgi:hypothetical protein